MSSVRLLTRSLARHSFKKGNSWVSGVGAVRFSSYFTPAHEYIQVSGNIGTVGITDYAQSALGDIVYIDLPDIGDTFDKGDSFGSVESVKAASDVYCPVGGKIVDVNSKLSDEPSLVNTDAETDAWFVKIEIKDPTELEGLLDPAKYKEHCDKQP